MNKHKKIVLFDIDYTVFNTTTFRRNLHNLLSKKLMLDHVIIKQLEQQTKQEVGYFKPRLFLTLLHKQTKKKISLEELEHIFFDESLYLESLYTDARSVFQELVMKRNIEIVIFSTGEKEFQMQKIEILKQMMHEDNIHIFIDKLKRLKDILTQYNDSHLYIVDDLPTVLQEAKRYNPSITTIWINRDPNTTIRDFTDDFQSDYSITELTAITNIVLQH